MKNDIFISYLLALSVLFGAIFTVGCRQKMSETPRYEPYERSLFFRDSLSARPIEEGVVSRSGVRYGDQQPIYESDTAAQGRTMPFPVTQEVLERGQQQFNVYCSPCHSRVGDGRGMIVQRGLRPPPSFHTERLRNAPLSHFYDVMTNGYGAMYSYANRTSQNDRWAIAAYIRALQLSQHATPDAMPPNKRTDLESVQP
jgi:mono/diheme cytochrome c family protein